MRDNTVINFANAKVEILPRFVDNFYWEKNAGLFYYCAFKSPHLCIVMLGPRQPVYAVCLVPALPVHSFPYPAMNRYSAIVLIPLYAPGMINQVAHS